METNKLRNILREIIIEILELEAEELKDDLDFFDVYNADSVSFLELITAIEKRLKFHYVPHQVSSISCVDELVEVTKEYVEFD
ncbi:MAG: phosphopantetheine-binding protein [Cyanobacteria bacterium P01_A01_bin.84]